MIKTFLFLLVILCPALAIADHIGTISGTVKDKITGEPLPGASIFIRELSSGTTADVFGHFTMSVKPGKYSVDISFVGYQTESLLVIIDEHKNVEVQVKLTQGVVQLSDLVITSTPALQRTNSLSSVDINLRPVNTSQDVLRMVPGLVIAQHAGGGKAEQIFLRGFDIDHGTDINLTVDGIPVNMVSHAHGQGYSDLHFVIPETIRNVDFEKGPYYTAKGDFATTGYVAFNTFSSLENNLVKIEGGQFGMLRNVNLLKLYDRTSNDRKEQIYIGSEFFRSDGFFEAPQDFRRLNGLLKYVNRVGDKKLLTLSLSGFSTTWNSSGQIPERAVESGMISRFGAIDDAEGGTTSRYNLNFTITNRFKENILQQQLFTSVYDFDLLSNFTFYLNDPLNGDRIQQSESRNLFGYQVSYTTPAKFHSMDMTSEYGLGIRHDIVNNSKLANVYAADEVKSYISNGDISQSNIYAYTEYGLNFASSFRINAGLRLDQFVFNYKDHLSAGTNHVSKSVFSPKVSLEYNVSSLTKVFAKAGYGFHSNDARIIHSQSSRQIVPKALGIDAGTEWKLSPDILLQTSLWLLDLDQELVYVGDEGIVEAAGATFRKGIDFSLRYQLSRTLFIDTDLNYTIARFKEGEKGEDYIPLAPSFTSIGGVSYKGEKLDWSLRYRHVKDRPANEDNSLTAEGYLLLDGVISYKMKRYNFSLSVENILNSEWKEAQFETESRLKHEAEPVTEIHFTPGIPRFVKAGVQIQF